MRLRGGEFSSMEGEFGSGGHGDGGEEEDKRGDGIEEEEEMESDDWLKQDIKEVERCAKADLLDSGSGDSKELEFEEGGPRTRDEMLEELRDMIRADEEAERGFIGAHRR